MDLEQADLLEHAATCAWDGLDPDSPEFADAFWATVTPSGLPSAPTAGIVVLGLAAALLAKRFDLVALAARLAANGSEAVLRDCLELADELFHLLVGAAQNLRRAPPDLVRSSGRFSAVLTPRFARPNPSPA